MATHDDIASWPPMMPELHTGLAAIVSLYQALSYIVGPCCCFAWPCLIIRHRLSCQPLSPLVIPHVIPHVSPSGAQDRGLSSFQGSSGTIPMLGAPCCSPPAILTCRRIYCFRCRRGDGRPCACQTMTNNDNNDNNDQPLPTRYGASCCGAAAQRRCQLLLCCRTTTMLTSLHATPPCWTPCWQQWIVTLTVVIAFTARPIPPHRASCDIR